MQKESEKLRTQGMVHLCLKYTDFLWVYQFCHMIILLLFIWYYLGPWSCPPLTHSIILSHFQSKLLQITWISVASEESSFTWKWWQSNKRNVDGGTAECATHPHSGFWFCWLLKGSVGRGISVIRLLGLHLLMLHMFLHLGLYLWFYVYHYI